MDGQALVLNASNQNNGYVQLPAGILQNLTNFTIATWVRVDSYESWCRIFDFGLNSTY